MQVPRYFEENIKFVCIAVLFLFYLIHSDSIASYITKVVTTLLHQQVDPLPLCLLLQQYAGEGKPTSNEWTKLLKYSAYWLLDKEPTKVCKKTTLLPSNKITVLL